VLISGDRDGAVKLFKVVAGLWPWGRGRVEIPNDSSIFFMPQQPYLPVGSLRGAVTYPAQPHSFPDEEVVAALDCVGLGHRAARLDERAEWDKVLSLEERQRLAFVRLLLHRPNWIFIQEATDALDAEGEETMMELLDQAFADATVLTVGRHAALEAHHQRKLVLVKSPDGLVLIMYRRKTPRPAKPVARALYDRLVAVLRFGRPKRVSDPEEFADHVDDELGEPTPPPPPVVT
jgi:putative ATP-binding cassette transporter